jgi:hypothetical protein
MSPDDTDGRELVIAVLFCFVFVETGAYPVPPVFEAVAAATLLVSGVVPGGLLIADWTGAECTRTALDLAPD